MKSTSVITTVLAASALLLAGCGSTQTPPDTTTNEGRFLKALDLRNVWRAADDALTIELAESTCRQMVESKHHPSWVSFRLHTKIDQWRDFDADNFVESSRMSFCPETFDMEDDGELTFMAPSDYEAVDW